MFRTIIPIFLPSFEGRNLCILTSGFFRGPRLMAEGKVLETAATHYVLKDNGGKHVRIRLRRRFLDPIPDIEIGNETVEVAPPFRWHEQLWMSLAGSLMYLHVGLGFVVGLLAYSLNTRVFRSYQSQRMKFLFSGLVTAGVIILFFATVLGYAFILNAYRLRTLEADLNAEELKDVHAVHEPPRVRGIADSANPVDAFGYPARHADRPGMAGLLRGMQFSLLEAELSDAQSAYERDFRAERILIEAYDTFDVEDSTWADFFAAWIAHSPRSYIPYLARASHYYAMAWKSRGGAWAADTPEENFELMGMYFEASWVDIKVALSIEPRLPVAYSLLIGMARAQGNHAAGKLFIEKALTLCPYSFSLRAAYMMSLLPRWGGSYAAMDLFAKQAMTYANVNPKLAILQGYADWDRGRVAQQEKDYSTAVQFYTNALRFGEYPTFLFERGSALYRQARYQEAFADLRTALEANPWDVETLAWLAGTAYQLGLTNDCSRYIRLAMALDGGSSQVLSWKRWIVNQLVQRSLERAKERDYGDALEIGNRALELGSENADALYARALAEANLGETVQAANDALGAIRIDPHHFNSYRLIDYLYATRGDWETVIAYWNKFLDIEPNNGAAYLERGGANMHKGDVAAALRDAEKACNLGQAEGCEIARQLRASR